MLWQFEISIIYQLFNESKKLTLLKFGTEDHELFCKPDQVFLLSTLKIFLDFFFFFNRKYFLNEHVHSEWEVKLNFHVLVSLAGKIVLHKTVSSFHVQTM